MFYDFTRGGVATAPYDDYGHGTHVAGLVASQGRGSDRTFVGVARDAFLVGLKVLTADGSGTTSDVIAAIEFATVNKAALGIDVINLSLGHPPFEPASTDPLVRAILQLTASAMHNETYAVYHPLVQGAGEINGIGALKLTHANRPVQLHCQRACRVVAAHHLDSEHRLGRQHRLG